MAHRPSCLSRWSSVCIPEHRPSSSIRYEPTTSLSPSTAAMKAPGAHDAGPPSSWLSTLSQWCAPLTSCLERKSRRSKSMSLTTTSISWPVGRSSDQDLLIDKDDEKAPRPVVYEQPAPQYRPIAEPEIFTDQSIEERPRKGVRSNRTGYTLKKRFRSDGSTRRPRISGPSEFRHLESGSFQFPPLDPTPVQPQQTQYTRYTRRTRPSSFRPLELSIYMPKNHMSPILPHFEFPNLVTPPQPAHLGERLDEDHQLLLRQRTNSSTPFHLPRKAVAEDRPATASENDAPIIPPKSQARSRAHTSPESPEVETMKARVAGAMIEVERLQKQIDEVIERQSLYERSRPSTPLSMARTMPGKSLKPMIETSGSLIILIELEPMPSIPALPPAAPSFAARLNSDIDRPQTAPLKTACEIYNRSQEFGEAMTNVSTPSHMQSDYSNPPPPLPLVLRAPPLRKKKSFSRVSTWLFPSGQHSRDVSLDSVTNLARPVKGTEGFYQCVPPGENERRSFESIGTVSTWDSDEQRTVPTTWSPGSTPMAKQEGPPLERTATFGESSTDRPGRTCVGVSG